MHPIFFTFFIAVSSIQRIHETYFSKKINARSVEKIEKITLKIMTLIHAVVILGTVLEYFFLHRKLNIFLSISGLIMYLLALIVRYVSVKTLGPYHSYNVEILENHQLVRQGIYKYMRHPIYAVTILELFSIPLVGNAYFSLCIALFFYMPVLGIRLFLEENELVKKFGEEYIKYKEEVPALLPFMINRNKRKKVCLLWFGF